MLRFVATFAACVALVGCGGAKGGGSSASSAASTGSGGASTSSGSTSGGSSASGASSGSTSGTHAASTSGSTSAASTSGSSSGSTGGGGVDLVVAGEYLTFWRVSGRLYGVAGTLPRLGAGDHPGPPFPPNEVAFPAGRRIVNAAGGLHFAIAADDQGAVWEWGDNTSNPALEASNVPLQITTDSQGQPFTLDGAGHHALSMACSIGTSVAVKGDGTVWVWDDTTGGLQGDGSAGSSTVTQPVQVVLPLPSGVTVTKVVIAEVIVALASDGSVWSWGGNGVAENLGRSGSGLQPGQVTGLPADIVDVATGQQYSYALTSGGQLYLWGLYAEIAGACSSWCPKATPVLFDPGLPSGSKVASVTANSEASYAILSDGTLWAWGSNGEGLVGNGVETDFSTTNPPYTWDWGKDDLLVSQAVQLVPGVSNFTQVFTGTADVFYTYALTRDGQLYSWGRNKTCSLGNGVCPLNSQEAAQYPNSWDVPLATPVSPMTAPYTPTTSPACVTNPNADNCWCGSGPSSPQGC